jgi:uncharacterized metal-binding protein YceD (DUF177 family)
MKIHLRQIPVEGLHIEGEEDREILEIADEKTEVLSRVRYSLDVGLSDGGLFATGFVEADLRLECVRCLEKFDFLAEVPDFAVQVELATSETVDLTEEIREDILLTLPAHPHCDRDGAQTCSGVRDLPQIRDEITEEPTHGSAQGDLKKNPWISLDKFKPKD